MSEEFSASLASLCSREFFASMRAADREERIANMVERLTHMLAFTIANVAGDDAKAAQEFMTGVEAHLYEAVTGMPRVANMRAAP